MPAAAFSFAHITKTFGKVRANEDVSFEVEASTVHGVVGENGAGKSTIMKTLYGMYLPDSGVITLRGQPAKILSPQHAIRLGIGMVHQHFMLIPTLRVWENTILGAEPNAWRPNRKTALVRLQSLQEEFGFHLDLNARVSDLPVGLQQQVEILKLLYRQADILIFDEPTAVLTPQEVGVLLERLHTLRDQGKTIIFISHKLREILHITQRVTVMRQGKVVETCATSDLSEESLAEKMIGRKMRHLPTRKQIPISAPLVQAKDLALGGILNGVDLELRGGEIVGIAGVEGNGQQELVEILARARDDYEGELLWQGASYGALSPYAHKQQGLSVVPPDRHQQAVLLDSSLAENRILGHHREPDFCQRSRLKWGQILKHTQDTIAAFDVRPPDPHSRMRSLSGGNQQKFVVGRELAQKVKLLIAAHPTRGVDIGAIERIHTEILRLRDGGAAVLLVSSELEEVLALSDRILVMYGGKIQGECTRATANETQLGLWMTGGGK